VRVRIALTQEEIAQIIGASRETVTRLFSLLKRDQIIRVKRDALWIRNSDALASIAQLSPRTFG
jgi:CRP/FNR family transcriptional regulator, cyclic AMP receptor protein